MRSGKKGPGEVQIPKDISKKDLKISLKPAADFFEDRVGPFLNFKFLNIALAALLLLFFGYTILQLFVSPVSQIKKISESSERQTPEDKDEIQVTKPKDYEYYNKQFAKRDIFSAPAIEGGAEGSSVVAQQTVKDFKLVGIILDKQPQAILENSVTKETYFLNEGDKLDRIQIKEILESKVVIIYAGEEIELEL